jgi:multidrug resistance efflux pump
MRIGAAILLAAALIGGAVFFFARGRATGAPGEKEEPSEAGLTPIPVKTVHPRLDKNYQMTVERPAEVEAYYRADIEARVPGVMKTIRVAAGSRVKEDQRLAQIDVPDLQEQVERGKADVEHAKAHIVLMRAKVASAEADLTAARAAVERAKASRESAQAATKFRTIQYGRIKELAEKGSIDLRLEDEKEEQLLAAKEAENAAIAAVSTAQAEVAAAEAKVKQAKADVQDAVAQQAVADAELRKAQVMVGFATLRAPFRGDVVSRKVDPGDFVQNASTGHPTPILTLERTDIVTVVIRVPDNYAPFVGTGTEAIVQLDPFPGLKIRGQVTRFAPSLVTAARDHTMRVEVDLWNGTAAEYQQFIREPRNLSDLKEGPLPLMPKFTGKNAMNRSIHLMPGMYGQMTLVLRTFGDTYLLPSQSLVREGGRSFIYVLREGKAQRVPVEVQVDDGTLAKVERLGPDGEVLGDLTGNEEVVVTNQEELTEGQPVNPTPLEDWKALDAHKTSH